MFNVEEEEHTYMKKNMDYILDGFVPPDKSEARK